MISENNIVEHAGAVLLLLCMLKSLHYVMISRYKQGRYFWIASFIVFFLVLRKELNYLRETFSLNELVWLGQSYKWWEDTVLTVIGVIALVLLVLSRRYCLYILKRVPPALYAVIVMLAVLQYMGEHAIGFSEWWGVLVEEMCESIVYAIALVYMWRLKLPILEKSMAD